ncbi:hypothetical protein GL213_06850 [Halogeometricum borinquense]|uniref:Transcriptional regulator n=1 Tax=Halogeometricum borinquense TaxID=60847 RepID=A0A6C0UHU6_9EURY|nr:DUF5821 family protein [Halogeometricum borinquense]QIB74790.1 hypothetical protein G3I44_11155 [Halogeometricum borinquense]QIQ76262.1 hypothetical protein GL213_06850 [Halogeometricum borinquense]
MTIDSNMLTEDAERILRSVLDSGTEDVLVVDPTADVIDTLVAVASETEDGLPEIRMIADESVLKDVMDDFIVASNAADLVESESLSMRTTDNGTENALLITKDAVVSLVTAGDQVAGLVTTDDEFVAAAYDTYTTQWEDAPQYKLRTPPIERVRATLEEEISADARDDFDSVLSSLQTARGDGDGLDEVTISLLVAAKNEVLLYDISKWGEDVGIASKATFSRTKTKLEEMGLIDTEKVPIDVGRPRLRLKLGDDRLVNADPDQLAGVAQSLLA